MSLATPNTVQKLQRALYVKAKSEQSYRFYSLIDKLYRKDILEFAWKSVRSNKGSPGYDGISFEDIALQGDGSKSLGRSFARETTDRIPFSESGFPRLTAVDDRYRFRPFGIE